MDIETVKKNMPAIAKTYRLDIVLLFGSQAKRNTHKKSDVDIAYFSKNKLTLEEESKLVVDLMDACKSAHVDLVNIGKASPLLAKRIVDACVVLYQKEGSLFSELFIYATRKYHEAKVLFAVRDNYVNRKASEYTHAR